MSRTQWSRLAGAALTGPLLLLIAMPGFAEPTVRGIHITRQGQNKSQVSVLKLARDQCLQERSLYADIKRTQPQVWAMTEKDMKIKRPNYDLQRTPAAEPDWSKVAIEREDEYFDGDKHAVIQEKSDYKIADDGSCALRTEPMKTSDLDDGTYRYILNLTKGTGTKHNSPQVVRARGRRLQRDARQDTPGLDEALASMAMQAGVADAARAGADIGKVTGHAMVAGQKCDYVASGLGDGAQLCYWSRMHHYPGLLRRPVVLQSTVVLGGETNSKQAILFETLPRIDSNIFVPPKDITIKDRARR